MSKKEELLSLIDAATRGDIRQAQNALNAGAPINGRVTYGKTAFMFAVQNAHPAILTLLKSRGARINMVDDDAEHPLIYAFTTGGVGKDILGKDVPITEERQMEVLRTLFLMGADVSAEGEMGTPALHYAAEQMSAHHVLELAWLGLPVDTKDRDCNETFAHAVARKKAMTKNDARLLIELCASHFVNFRSKNERGETAQQMALRYENAEWASAIQDHLAVKLASREKAAIEKALSERPTAAPNRLSTKM